MEMETRVNEEMALRYRNSVISSPSNDNQSQNDSQQKQNSGDLASNSSKLGSPFLTPLKDGTQFNENTDVNSISSSAFTQPLRSCTVDDLNEVSNLFLIFFDSFMF